MENCTNDPVAFCREVLGMELWEKQAEILRNIPDGSKPMRWITGPEAARAERRRFTETLLPYLEAEGYTVL